MKGVVPRNTPREYPKETLFGFAWILISFSRMRNFSHIPDVAIPSTVFPSYIWLADWVSSIGTQPPKVLILFAYLTS